MQRSACQRQAAARGRDSARRLLRRLSAERLEPRNLLAISAQLLVDINPGGGESAAGGYEVVGNTAFFSANNGVTGRELWKTDGTAAGTVLVRDIVPGPAESFPRFLTNIGGTLFFVAPDPATGEHFQLWKSDGTAAGTVRVSDLDLGRIGGAAPELANVNGTLLFRAGDATGGAELWKSDGTTAGTVLVSDIAAGEVGSDPRYLTNVNGTLFFRASSREGGAELWKSDGTAAGTALVQDLGAGNNTAGPKQLTNVNGTLFFTAFGDVFGGQLWKSDGTTAGTVLVKDAGIGGIANIGGLTNVGGTLLFSANDGVYGQELWKSDGTFAGTVLVRDLNVERGAYPWNLTNVGGTLFFTALVDGPAAGFVIGKSDGTASGTTLVERTDAAFLTDVRGTLFFSDVNRLLATGGARGDLLEIVGPEGATPTTIYGVVNLNGRLLFTADDRVHGAELWSVVTVNEAPSFLKGADQQATDSGGPRTIDNWATAISAGPFYESWQQLSFSVVAENPALFAVQPAIDAAGRLTFAPLPNASGSTLVTVVLSDNGGTAGGGLDASPPQTFTITVIRPNPLQNTWQPLDTSGDGAVSALDAVLVINFLNSPPPGGSAVSLAEGEADAADVYYDVSGDDFISPLDAVLIINHLNANRDLEAPSGEPDSLIAAPAIGTNDAAAFASLMDLLASDAAARQARRRLRG